MDNCCTFKEPAIIGQQRNTLSWQLERKKVKKKKNKEQRLEGKKMLAGKRISLRIIKAQYTQ